MSTQIMDLTAVPGATLDFERAALMEQIRELARSRNAIILAHNYQWPDVQDVADVTGDSLGLALAAQKTDAQTIVFCGVHFMAESAKVLNPDKRVLLPNLAAGCSLADSISPESLEEWKARYPGYTVVTYVNSTAEVKALSDICCTSANAVSVVRSLPTDKILFTPDRNLGNWVAKQVPEKHIVIYDGVCPTHDVLRGANVKRVRSEFPGAVVIAHPECREDIIAIADEVSKTDRSCRADSCLSSSHWLPIASGDGSPIGFRPRASLRIAAHSFLSPATSSGGVLKASARRDEVRSSPSRS